MTVATTSICRWCGRDVLLANAADSRWSMIAGLCAYRNYRFQTVGGCRLVADVEAAVRLGTR